MNNIQLAHGSGGQAMQQLINSLFMEAFANPWLAEQEDQARLDLAQLVAKAIVWRSPPTVTSLTRCSFLAVISASWRFAAPRMTLRSVALFRAISPVALSSKKDCRWRH